MGLKMNCPGSTAAPSATPLTTAWYSMPPVAAKDSKTPPSTTHLKRQSVSITSTVIALAKNYPTVTDHLAPENTLKFT